MQAAAPQIEPSGAAHLPNPGANGSRREPFVPGGGEMSALVGAFDWASTPLGPIEAWPQSLKAVVRILLTSRYAMWMGYGPELTFLYNDAYARMTLGKKHPWALGRPSREVWPEIWKDIGPRIQKVLDTGEATWDEALLLFLERNGYLEESYHTFSYSPLAAEDGSVRGHLCVVTEETERVMGERQFASLRLLASELATNLTEGNVFTAVERCLTENPKDLPFALIYLLEEGGAKARLVATAGIERGHRAAPETISVDAEDATWPVREMLAQNSPVTLAGDLKGRFGALPKGAWNTAPTRALLTPIAQPGQDAPVGFLVSALNPFRKLDISYTGYLELLAGQIAAGIANARAYEEERKRVAALAELDRAKTTFFSNISHELRTPLTLMLGPVEEALAKNPQTAPLAGEPLAMLHRNALRMLKLVNTLLDFSRIEAGSMKANREATDLAAFTADLASVFRSAITASGLQLSVDCPPLPRPVYLDRSMWEKVMLNLLSNALKSTFEGVITVQLRDRGEMAELTLRDTGTGIPEEELPHLFERFRRIENARRRSQEGAGIGLALVREMIELHGGSVAVESVVGEGTAFHVSVPYGESQAGQGAGPVAVASGGARAGVYVEESFRWPSELEIAAPNSVISLPPMEAASAARVLLVDDNRDMREYVSGLLQRHFTVITANNGRAALEMALRMSPPPDLVLTDVMMPEMDGFALLAELRRNPATRAIPVIMLSARAGEESRVEGLEAGADDYLVKPFTARELVARVGTHITMAKLRREGELALRQSQLQLQAALSASRTGTFRWNVETEEYAEFDDSLKALFGLASGAVVRRTEDFLATVHPDDLAAVLAAIERGRNNGDNQGGIQMEYRVVWPDGSVHWLYNRARLEQGFVVGACHDITERKQTQEALQRSEKLALVGRMASTIAHEINNPLEAVTNLLYLVRQGGSPQQLQEYIQQAEEELARVSHVVTHTLRFHRQAATATAEMLSRLLDSTVAIYQGRLKDSGILVERRYEDRHPVLCFAGEVRQVFANLIGNAFDASRRGATNRIILRTREATEWSSGRRGVRVTIADTGHGMDENTQKRLFEPFFTTKGINGTGLGLWLSRDILRKHHAPLRMKSAVDRGTVFSIFFAFE